MPPPCETNAAVSVVFVTDRYMLPPVEGHGCVALHLKRESVVVITFHTEDVGTL